MFENEDLDPVPERHPMVSLLMILGVVVMGFVVIGPLIGFFFSAPFFAGDMADYSTALQKPEDHPEMKLSLYILQGFATFFGLIIAPALYLKAEGKNLAAVFRNQKVSFIAIILTTTVVIAFMPFNQLFIDWNSKMQLPEFLKGFEDWARVREDYAMKLTKIFTQFDSTFEVALALFVVALLPAVGEEIVFRGLIQSELFRATRNIHVAIWVAAIMFSAFHFQFFGFVPRMLLGALFGYLYYWSGSLNVSILAHFVNNGTSIIGMYLFQLGHIEQEMETTEPATWPVTLSSGAVTIVLLYAFHRYYKQQDKLV